MGSSFCAILGSKKYLVWFCAIVILCLVYLPGWIYLSSYSPTSFSWTIDTSSSVPTNVSINDQPPRRILLGISSQESVAYERQLRHVIRHTYLSLENQLSLAKNGNGNQHPIVCSLEDFLQQQQQQQQHSNGKIIMTTNKYHCRLVYTFVFGGNSTGTIKESFSATTIALNRSIFSNHEQDVVYLNIPESSSEEKRLAWCLYANKYTATTNQSGAAFVYVAYTDTRTLFLPDLFWKQLYNLPMENAFRQHPTTTNNKQDFVLLSRDLLQTIITNLNTTFFKDEGIKSNSLLLQGIQTLNNSDTISSKYMAHEYLAAWDDYQDSVISYTNSEEVQFVSSRNLTIGYHNTKKPRMLVGIFSMNTAEDSRRRNVIRQTWISHYYQTTSDTPHRICSLQNLLSNATIASECQLAYVFVIGGNPNGSTSLLKLDDHQNTTTSTWPLSTHCQLQDNGSEVANNDGDTVCLNIQENMNNGKSESWFYYAASSMDRHYFEYIGKMDSDTLPHVDSLMDQLDRLPPFPNHVRTYGGNWQIKPSVKAFHVGPAYMGGAIYFLSTDLARYLGSRSFKGFRRSEEDKAIGNYVHSHPLPIRRVRWPVTIRQHPLKSPNEYKRQWVKQQQQQ